MRLSQENENRQRAPNHQPTTTHRAQKAFGLTGGQDRSFSRSRRLRRRDEFRRVKKYGKRMTGQVAIFEILCEKFPYPRLGLTVSKRFGDAHLRNLFKRRAREAFRLSQSSLPPGIIIHISPRQEGIVPTLQQFLEDFARLV